MKIKMDFVSNSSSTSFVYIAQEMIEKSDFFEAAGVRTDSPIASLFEAMYEDVKTNVERGQGIVSPSDVDALKGRREFTPEVLERMSKAADEGQMVVVSTFSSENRLSETVLCMEIFELESDKFYINAFDNTW
jgi:hypothetical protein